MFYKNSNPCEAVSASGCQKYGINSFRLDKDWRPRAGGMFPRTLRLHPGLYGPCVLYGGSLSGFWQEYCRAVVPGFLPEVALDVVPEVAG